MVRVVQQRVFSPGDAGSLTLPAWDWTTVQVSPGSLGGFGRDLFLPHLQLHEEKYHGVTTNHFGVPPPKSVVISVSLNPGQLALVNGRIWRDGVCVWTADTEVNALVPPMCLYTVVLARAHLLDYVWESYALDLTQHLKDCPKICNAQTISGRLAGQLASTVSHCFDSNFVLELASRIEEVEEEILGYLIPVVVNTVTANARRPQMFKAQAKTVREARRYIFENLQRAVTIAELCEALGISRRQLQASFNDVVGISPLSYMRMVRLSKVQEALVHSDEDSVQAIASRWGFIHQGRFSQEYKNLFGEAPSQTIKMRPTERTKG